MLISRAPITWRKRSLCGSVLAAACWLLLLAVGSRSNRLLQAPRPAPKSTTDTPGGSENNDYEDAAPPTLLEYDNVRPCFVRASCF